jgi:hypothetical protein
MRRPVLDLASRWETEFSIPIHSFLFQSRFFKEQGIRFDESLPNHVDWDCWMRIFLLDPVILNIPEPLAIYRLHGDNLCADIIRMSKGYLKALDKQILVNQKDHELNAALRKKYLYTRSLHWNLRRRRAIEVFRGYIRRSFDRYAPLPLHRVVRHLRSTVGKPRMEKEGKGD